ncbi:MAG: hypothetical protein QM791_23735 [Ferruginibacter sp.]
MEWDLHISYKLKTFKLKAVLEFESAQIMRIRVHGQTSTLLLENNFPLIKAAGGKKGLNWKIKEGSLGASDQDKAQLMTDILEQLEIYLKKPNRVSKQEEQRDKKSW